MIFFISVFLRGGPQSHVDLAKRMYENMKTNHRLLSNCLEEIAQLKAAELKHSRPVPRTCEVHRQDGIDTNFFSEFLRHAPSIGDDEESTALIFLSSGELSSSKGIIQLVGKAEIVARLAPQFLEILDGKGKVNGQRFQAKVSNMSKIHECSALISAVVDELDGIHH